MVFSAPSQTGKFSGLQPTKCPEALGQEGITVYYACLSLWFPGSDIAATCRHGIKGRPGSVFFLAKMQRPEHPPGSGLIALMCNGSLAQNCATGISKNGSNDAIWRLLGHGSVGGNPSSKEYWS